MTPAETLALRLWRERELGFPPRTRRMAPDALDVASGAWALMVEEAERQIRPRPDAPDTSIPR
jgi:hypothetical protein